MVEQETANDLLYATVDVLTSALSVLQSIRKLLKSYLPKLLLRGPSVRELVV